MSSKVLAASAVGRTLSAVAHPRVSSVEVIQSPGGAPGDTKDQDRARWHAEDLVACVCDGLTSSPFAASAAEYVANRASRMFSNERAIHGMAAHLRRRRRQATS